MDWKVQFSFWEMYGILRVDTCTFLTVKRKDFLKIMIIWPIFLEFDIGYIPKPVIILPAD